MADHVDEATQAERTLASLFRDVSRVQAGQGPILSSVCRMPQGLSQIWVHQASEDAKRPSTPALARELECHQTQSRFLASASGDIVSLGTLLGARAGSLQDTGAAPPATAAAAVARHWVE